MITNERTTNWQVSINDPNLIVEDAEDIAQCVWTILMTVRGTDPLRPQFGSGIWQFIDQPMTQAQPALVYEVFESLGRWEPRIRIDRVRVYDADFDKKKIDIEATVVASAAQITVTVNL